MGTWRIPADVLATSRFTVSPLYETVAALLALGRAIQPWQRSFRATHLAAYEAMLDAHPVRRELGDLAWRPRTGATPGWMADFLGQPPSRTATGFGEELADLVPRWPDEAIRAELRSLRPGPLPQLLEEPGLDDELGALLRWVWTATVESDWPRRERVLQADIVSRTSRLASHGWAGVMGTLSTRKAWLGDGLLQVNSYDLPTRELAPGAELVFVPVHSSGDWLGWIEPDRYAVVYAVSGALAERYPVGDRDGLTDLVGPNRARLLRTLDSPHSTSQLVAVTGLPLGSVGNHLRVLLRSGCVLRRRAGREVLYWRTQIGDALVAAVESDPPPLELPRASLGGAQPG